ncbi:hypothetical protein [Vibrio methylphosphonaticus]|uniref:hypothetical protein n=1 Tax=Vibrio methylphosphonaticus TaxID=2946866 RepID=UPI00202A2AB2|nr:hypothetical protein [Vibrio methylphosphonaticus]MCL9776635.1 hypothetical protein [Vibrio methylphosphonaticus]
MTQLIIAITLLSISSFSLTQNEEVAQHQLSLGAADGVVRPVLENGYDVNTAPEAFNMGASTMDDGKYTARKRPDSVRDAVANGSRG